MTPDIQNPNAQLPLALIACTIAILLLSQVGASTQSEKIMK